MRSIVFSLIFFSFLSSVTYAANLQRVSIIRGEYIDQPVSKVSSKIKIDGIYKKIIRWEHLKKRKVLRIFGITKGDATLTIKDAKNNIIYNFRIDVSDIDLFKVKEDVKEVLRDIDGIKIKTLNNKVIIDGEVIRVSDFRRINQVIVQYGGRADSFVSLSRLAQIELAKIMQRNITNKHVNVEVINGNFMARGVVDSIDERERIWSTIDKYLPDRPNPSSKGPTAIQFRNKLIQVKDPRFLTVKPGVEPTPKLIEITVHYVTMNKDYVKNFNFSWTPTLSDESSLSFGTQEGSQEQANTNLPSAAGRIATTIQNFIPKLNWAKNHGFARVLKQGTILVRENQEGILRSESTKTVPIQSISGSDLKPITTGFNLSITPSTSGDNSENIFMKINIGSSIFTQGTDTESNSVNTQLSVGHGQTAAIGGFSDSVETKGFNKSPGGATNPIVNFTTGKSYIKTHNQFVFFLTPVIRVSASSGTKKIKSKFRLGR